MVLFGPGCKPVRRQPVEARMRPLGIVVVPPEIDDPPCLAMAAEQMFVQAFNSAAARA